jgi:hypothetical protein
MGAVKTIETILLDRWVRSSTQLKVHVPVGWFALNVNVKEKRPFASTVGPTMTALELFVARQDAVPPLVKPEPVAVNVVVRGPDAGVTDTCGVDTVDVVVVDGLVVELVELEVIDIVDVVDVVVGVVGDVVVVVELPVDVVVEVWTDDVVVELPAVVVVELPADEVVEVDGVDVVAGLGSATSVIAPSGEAPPQVLI